MNLFGWSMKFMLETFPDNKIKFSKGVRGFSLFAALFVIVILGMLAAAMIQMTQTSNVAVAQEALSIRAFFAAESGAQAAAMDVFPLSGGGSCSNRTINFSSNGLVGCSAIIQCSSFNSDGENYFQVNSEGRCGSGDLSTSRSIDLLLKEL